MDLTAKLPALRPIEITPIRDGDGQLFFQLRDQLQIAPKPLAISGAGYFVLMHLDGQHTIEDVQAVARRDGGQELPADEIRRVIEVLDHYALLDTPRFAQAYAAQRDAYLAAPQRDRRAHWPDEKTLRAEIERVLADARVEPVAEIRGLLAPHLDYGRGGPCYTAAYGLLKESRLAERYVIVGTNHFGLSTSIVATNKDFLTPLGLVPTDRAFLQKLEARLGAALCEHEFDHQTEHSVELQVQILQVCHAGRPFEIVPFICPDICGESGGTPRDGRGPTLSDFADALAATLAEDPRPTIIIAGADLSHVGQSFGDDIPTTAIFLAEAAQLDRRVLAWFEAGQEEEGLRELRAAHNPTRICSVGALYVLRRALRGRPWRHLRYHQAVDISTGTNVACAAAVVL